MLTPQHRQELVSRAYVAAIAASVGMNFSTRDFDYGIDLTLHEVTTRTNPSTGRKRLVESGRTLDLQIKSTTIAIMDQERIAYDLDVDGYDDVLSTLEERPAAEIASEMAEAPEVVADERRSRIDELIDIVARHIRGRQSATEVEQLAKDVLSLAENVELGLKADDVSFQEAALFLAGCARILSPADEPKLLLWRLCEWIGLKLRIPSPATLDELHELALTDDIRSPDTLLEWLLNHTLDEARDQTPGVQISRDTLRPHP